jgi:APA family basic amino acid/polyamine antiporter
VATATINAIFGPVGTVIMAVAIMISTFGCNNGLILAGARVYYAMARDNLFFKSAARVNSKNVPAVALLFQGVWAALLVLPRTRTVNPQTGALSYGNVYTQLLEYIVCADLVFYLLMVGAVIVLRKSRPLTERPYRAFGYPATPVLYIAIAAILILDLTYLGPETSGIGFLLVLTGFPVYFLWKYAYNRQSAAAKAAVAK